MADLKKETTVEPTAASEPEETEETPPPPGTSKQGPKKVALNAEFTSFLELRDAIERYQKENSVQLIVKDSKLLKAESTRKVIPKVYHMVNQNLMYHSITYCCKCHGELKQKPGTRIKNVGQKRLNCPMYMRFKLSPDLQKLVMFDIDETHNHGIDPTTFQMTPRQQVYKLSKMRHNKRTMEDEEDESSSDVSFNLANLSKDDSDYEPPKKSARLQAKAQRDTQADANDDEDENADDSDDASSQQDEQLNRPDSPLDSDSSCSDSDEEELRNHRALLPFPIRLIGSAIQSSPELLASVKQLIEIQKSKLLLEKQKLLLETKQLELTNSKLELEVRVMEKNLAAEMAESSQGRDTTIYVQAS